MGFVDTITNLFKRDRKPTTADTPTTATSVASPSRPAPMMKLFQTENNRSDRVEISRKMYEEDGRYKGICSTLARDAVKGGFQLKVKDKKAAEAIIALRKRIKLNLVLDDWCRLTYRDGDCFLELGVTTDREIAAVSRKPTLNMRRNSDDKDTFPDPAHAYWMAEHSFQIAPTVDTQWFAEWQIIHARWDHDTDSRYGRPLMASGRKAWKRITEGEYDVAVRRKTRAGKRLLHYVEGDANDIEAYKELNKPALEDPFTAHADFFTNKQGGITSLEGDSQIGNIDDLVHHIDTWWIESPVPKALLGYGKDLNRDIIDEQQDQYAETLETIREWVASSFLVPLFETQWLLMGILPETLEYEIVWPVKKVLTTRNILEAVQAAQLLRSMNVSEEVVAHVMAMFIPGIEAKDLKFNNEGNDANRLAKIAAVLAKTINRRNGAEETPPEGE